MAELMKMALCPAQASYAVEDNTAQTIRTQLDGGRGRYRRDILNSSALVDVRWVVTASGYDYLCAFKRVFEGEVEPFLIDLIIGEARLTECQAMIIPQSFRLEQVSGPAYTVSAQLEVTPPEYSIDMDKAIIWLVSVFGPEWLNWFNRLHYILHVRAPKFTNTPANIWTATPAEWEAAK